MNLYEINKNYLEILENGFVVDEETGELLFDDSNLEELEDEFNNKIDNIACYIKDLENLVNGIKNEKKALDERIKQTEAKTESLKKYLVKMLKMRNVSKLETTKNKLGFRKSTSVEVLNENLVNAKYFKEVLERKIDKKTILADLKNGIVVDGCELKEKENLQIK